MELPSQIDEIGEIGAMAERLLSMWTQGSRLHTLATPPGADTAGAQPAKAQVPVRAGDLLLERFELHEAVSEPFHLTLQVLMLDAHVPLKQLCGQALTLRTQLADGGHVLRSGIVTEVRALHADGGFARKALTVQPWVALLAHTLNSRIWQDRSLIDIVDDVLSQHPDLAVWRWDEGVAEHVAQGLFARNGGQRAYCVQHRESDLDFLQRLMAEEGVAWRVEESDGAPAGHGLVFFVHSQAQPQDPTSAGGWGAGIGLAGAGIRFHASPGQDSQASQDSIHALGHERRLGPTAHTVLGWDRKAHAAIAAEVPSRPDWGPEGDQGVAQLTPWLAQYDPTSGYLFGTPDEARFAATLLQQAEEARTLRWMGRGNVRTLRAGTWVAVATDGGLFGGVSGAHGDIPELFVTRVHVIGVNTLPKAARGDHADPKDHSDHIAFADAANDTDAGAHSSELQPLAARTGHACAFEAAPRAQPWRPALQDGTGQRLRPRPTAAGPQTAIVVGPQGRLSPTGADDIHTDAMGRVRVRFHWQGGWQSELPKGAEALDSCWLRVQQRLAGAAMGHQFIPRIGQEVLVGFLGNDIDRPVVIASLYNGQGESGIAPTPGGLTPDGADAGGAPGAAGAAEVSAALTQSSDHTPASQMNLIGEGAGGHSPAWHGAAPGAATEGNPGQANAAALSGIKSQAFGGSGHNQLVLDDTPQQLRARLHTTQAQTWLEMGHLLHQADNHRGSLRGQGLELRTDAWGGLRAARGLLLSTYSLRQAGGSGLGISPEPAGDNAAGIALARQMQQLTQAFHQAASTHQTVGLASGVQASSDLALSLRGSVSTRSLNDAVQDAQARNMAAQSTAAGASSGDATVPHLAAPHIALVGQAGVGLTAGQDVHLSSQGATTVASGQDSHWAVGGQARVHTGQAIGVLAGAMQPGGADASGQSAAGKGLTLIAAQGAIDLQAQNGPAQVAAQQTLEIKTAQGVVHVAAAKRVVLATSGGAGITLEGGQLTVQCPGKITVRAGSKSMVGPGTLAQAMNAMPGPSRFDDAYVVRNPKTGDPMPYMLVDVTRADSTVLRLTTDAQGRLPMQKSQLMETLALRVLGKRTPRS
ncbi:type VI secretion system Vgr family protein [Aquabacterium sp.]|uniref:type VI secretion system Vgr family protein n=1 Tax=Aquabacterium sp. TaxID=1872578 RepID=UPI0025C2C163|nr:type VI secretion system Vgr family protein [Aquabacterium sp.]